MNNIFGTLLVLFSKDPRIPIFNVPCPSTDAVNWIFQLFIPSKILHGCSYIIL